jgi:GNAT superfamily N-acetyltransferase
MRIEAATPQLLPRLADLRAQMELELERRDLDARVEGWRERFIEFFSTRQQLGTSQPFIAIRDGEVIGMAIASVVDDYRAFALGQRRGYINTVYVIPAARKGGIGRALTEAATAWLRAQGCVAVRLNPSAQAEALYRSMGFAPSGELKLDL